MLHTANVKIRKVLQYVQYYGQFRPFHIKRIELYQKCCRILNVPENADQSTVRRAYIEIVKKVHPDSGLPEASQDRFQEVDDAFKLLQEKFAKNRRGIYEDDEEEVPDIRHTAPQHRQYLSFDGMGIGNPFQRQKQYQQIKAMKAQQSVLQHRLEKSQAGETNLIKKGGTYYKKHAVKTKYGFERVVEDLIQEAMSKGDFNNLNGAGKPLTSAQSQNPYLDFTTQKLNKILLDNGFTPEWITLQRDIRDAVKLLKEDLQGERAFFGDYPFINETDASEWENVLSKYENNVVDINKNIDKYNLIVPIMENQLFRLDIRKIGDNILSDPNLPKNFKRPNNLNDSSGNSGQKKSESTGFLSFFSSIF